MGNWISIKGVVVCGHRVASGPSAVYPYGSLEKQIPFFKQLGFNLESYYPGTINISIAPRIWKMQAPEYTFKQIPWTDLHPPEDFSFSACRVQFKQVTTEGWIYYPHPETKIRHFQDSSLIEVITSWIPNLGYGSNVVLMLRTGKISADNL